MSIDRSGTWWTGTHAGDLEPYLVAYGASRREPIQRVIPIVCGNCAGDEFTVRVDDEQGCAERTCTTCGTTALVFDSADTLDEAELDDATCPCGGTTFNAAAGFSVRADGDVRWVYLGLRCIRDGVLGCYTDWKIDYSPTDHLFAQT